MKAQYLISLTMSDGTQTPTEPLEGSPEDWVQEMQESGWEYECVPTQGEDLITIEFEREDSDEYGVAHIFAANDAAAEAPYLKI